MSGLGDTIPRSKKRTIRLVIFPALVLLIYCILFVIVPDKTIGALRASGKVFLNILIPLCAVFILMVVLNIFLKPAHITKLLGKEAGVRGVMLSAMAGIVSMGPIYAWYPLLKSIREKGVRPRFITIFLGNRAVKPFLLPIMISYFGGLYVLILTAFTIFGSVVAGYCVEILIGKSDETGS